MKTIPMLILFLLTIVPVGSAELADLNPINAGSSMIADGIDRSISNVADDIMGGFSEKNATATTSPPSVTDMIKSFAVWSVEPFTYKTVIDMLGLSLCCGAFFMLCYVFLGAAYAATSQMSTKKLELFHYLMNTKSGSVFQNYGQNVVIGCIGMMFMPLVVFLSLLLARILKMMIMNGIADAISPTLATVSVLYLAMAMMWCMVAIFFGISNIVICITAGLSIFLGALYASDRTRHITVTWMDYFWSMVAMQVFVILTVALSVGAILDIKASGAGNMLFVAHPMAEFSMYMGLIMFLLVGCALFVFGKVRVIKSGKRLVKLVI